MAVYASFAIDCADAAIENLLVSNYQQVKPVFVMNRQGIVDFVAALGPKNRIGKAVSENLIGPVLAYFAEGRLMRRLIEPVAQTHMYNADGSISMRNPNHGSDRRHVSLTSIESQLAQIEKEKDVAAAREADFKSKSATEGDYEHNQSRNRSALLTQEIQAHDAYKRLKEDRIGQEIGHDLYYSYTHPTGRDAYGNSVRIYPNDPRDRDLIFTVAQASADPENAHRELLEIPANKASIIPYLWTMQGDPIRGANVVVVNEMLKDPRTFHAVFAYEHDLLNHTARLGPEIRSRQGQHLASDHDVANGIEIFFPSSP
jgi:hypothetical protein